MTGCGCCAGWSRVAAGWSSAARRSRTRSPPRCIATSRGRNPASDPFSGKGRAWIAAQQLPIDERLTVDAGLGQLDFLDRELRDVDRLIAQQVLEDADVRRLRTIPGIDAVTAATLVAVIGDVRRFPSSRHLVGYPGLHPTIRQSGNGPAHHGPVSKERAADARHGLV